MKLVNRSILVIVICSLIASLSCNKSKRYSKRMDGNKWEVIELTVNGTAQSDQPDLLFKECDIYKESCEGSWIMPNDGRAQFAWQFRDKGKILEISNQTDHIHSYEDLKASEACIAYSGIYEVKKSKMKELTIESTQTNGYKGMTVKIILKKK